MREHVGVERNGPSVRELGCGVARGFGRPPPRQPRNCFLSTIAAVAKAARRLPARVRLQDVRPLTTCGGRAVFVLLGALRGLGGANTLGCGRRSLCRVGYPPTAALAAAHSTCPLAAALTLSAHPSLPCAAPRASSPPKVKVSMGGRLGWGLAGQALLPRLQPPCSPGAARGPLIPLGTHC